jgi:hypothetical protein
LSIASKEKVPFAFGVSVAGRRLCQKMDFQTIQRTPLPEGVEGLEDVVAMLWDPDPPKGNWREELDDSSVKLRKI